MSEVPVFTRGGYRYIKAVFQYSGGIAAEPGFEIVHARFKQALAMEAAYAAVEAHLAAVARPMTAFAACELRSPAPFTDQGFVDFNQVYVKTLQRWGIYLDGAQPVNPVARTNVCPLYHKPVEPVMYAFSYTVPAPPGARKSFILAGGGDARSGSGSYAERIVRLGDTSPEALREKVLFVAAEMERRLGLLGLAWADATSTQLYTVQNIGHLIGEVLAARGAGEGGLAWHYCRPPVIGLEFEMDVRGPAREIVI